MADQLTLSQLRGADYDIFNNYTDGRYEEEYNGIFNDKYYQDNDVISNTSTGLYKTNTLSIR